MIIIDQHMAKYNHQALADLNEDKVLRDILTGTAPETGQGFFRALVAHMAKAMNTRAAMVCELVKSGPEIDDTCNLRAIAFWVQGQWNDVKIRGHVKIRGQGAFTVLALLTFV